MPAYLLPLDQGKKIVLEKAIVFIGRHPECDILLTQSRKISRKHCCIAQVNDAIMIRDLGSMNGVHVNGKRVEREVRLKIDDEVMIGDCRFVFKATPKNAEKNGDSASAKRTVEKPAGKSSPSNIARGTPRPVGPPTPENDFPLPGGRRKNSSAKGFGEASTPDAFPLMNAKNQNSKKDLDDDLAVIDELDVVEIDDADDSFQELELVKPSHKPSSKKSPPPPPPKRKKQVEEEIDDLEFIDDDDVIMELDESDEWKDSGSQVELTP